MDDHRVTDAVRKEKKKDGFQADMVMQDAVDSAEIDMSTSTRKRWYIEAG